MWATLVVATLLSGRFAIVATAGEAAGQTPLQYVDADADRVSSVLEDLGNVDRGHVLRVRNATPASLRAALAGAESGLRGDPDGVLVLYFSGHADEQGLLLGGERFDYRELRQLLTKSTVRTRVVLLDACRSGGALTSKGGRQAAAFDVSALRPETVSGAAIIAASTAVEAAQESSRLEGSFFTHHLVSGLRGAADQNADGRVTLAESYAYAYAQTLSSTSTTLLGPQHPSYQYDLAGAGELVLTELGRAQAALSLPVGAPGDLLMVFDARDNLVAEVPGGAARPVTLALRAGSYRVARRRGDRAAVGTVSLSAGTRVSLDDRALRDQPAELALAKGARRRTHAVFVDGGLVYAQTGAIPMALEVGLSYDHALPRWHLLGRVATGSGESSFSVYEVSRQSAQAAVLRRLPLGATEVGLGVGAGVARFVQDRQGDRLLDPRAPDHLEGTAGSGHLVLAFDVALGDRVSLRLGWRGGAMLLRGNGALHLRPEILTNVGLGAHF
ncbi:MAG TPA: caspase family protein [Polyangia bacterium]|nr:caspase family protein [Polyangia bacterium]